MKKNMRRFFTFLISFVLIATCFTSVASAHGLYLEGEQNSGGLHLEDSDSNLHLSDGYQNMDVYVNDKQVRRVSVYMDNHNDIWVSSYSDVRKIFPDETEDLIFPTEEEPTSLQYWADSFGYTMSTSIRNNKVYLEKEVSVRPNPDNSETEFPYIVPEEEETVAKVYINGMKFNSSDIYMDDNGNIRLKNAKLVFDIFPKETKNLQLKSNSSTYLRAWADYYGYAYAQRGIRVYLNNDKVEPIEIHLNWDIVDFPDQQPYVTNGRTLIPVRAISETLGWNVSWNNAKVTISNGSHTVVLHINSKAYTLDGKEKALDVPAQVVNGRTMVPIRFIAEAFGYTVTYDGSGSVKLVTLTK